MESYGPEVSVEDAAYVHPSAWIYGRVRLAAGSSIWPGVVIRAESFEVTIGPHSNVQDGVVIHVGDAGGTAIGAYVSIGHGACVHGATVEDACIIGINSTLMDGVVIGENSIVGSGAVVTAGTVVPANSVVMGAPGRVVKTRNNWVATRLNASLYSRNALAYARGEHRAWHGAEYDMFLEGERARLTAEFARRFPATGHPGS